jgi:glycopeptide antibiotics resistance protein
VQVWIEELEYGFAFFAIVGVLLLAPWVRAQYRAHGRMHGWAALVSAGTVLYACGLIAFTLFQLPDFTPQFCARHDAYSHWQWSLLGDFRDVASYEDSHSVLQTLTSQPFLQLVMNVVLFLPLGFLIGYRWRGGLLRAVTVSFAVSLLIELTQGTGLWGLAECPYRLADVDDLMMNTLGGVLGWLVARLLARRLPDPRPDPVPDLDDPGLVRRGVAVALDALVYLLVTLAALIPLEERTGGPDPQSWGFAAVSVAVSLALFVGFPLVRAKRSTPGAASVMVLPVRRDGRPASAGAVITMWALRWIPVAAFGLTALVVVTAIDGLVAWRRHDHRGLVGLLSRTRIITEEQRQASLRP